jgi:hypothetical protein
VLRFGLFLSGVTLVSSATNKLPCQHTRVGFYDYPHRITRLALISAKTSRRRGNAVLVVSGLRATLGTRAEASRHFGLAHRVPVRIRRGSRRYA